MEKRFRPPTQELMKELKKNCVQNIGFNFAASGNIRDK
jgi:hypothetical protein